MFLHVTALGASYIKICKLLNNILIGTIITFSFVSGNSFIEI